MFCTKFALISLTDSLLQCCIFILLLSFVFIYTGTFQLIDLKIFEMEEFCKHMNISHPPIITLQEAIEIHSTLPQEDVTSLHELPMYMLNRIMILDCGSRKIPKSLNPLVPTQNITLSDMINLISQSKTDTNAREVHPMDVFIYLFIKCDPLFRQTFVTQVSKCQLSLPLITTYPSALNPTFYLFALKTLYKDYLTNDNVGKSFSVTEEKMPIISFIRIGECGKSQKSEMLNQIIGIPDYFFHRNLLGNSKMRFLFDGTVEIAWLLPKSNYQSTESSSFIILNLRGDASQFSKQLNFITDVSTLIYLFIPFNQCDSQMSQYLIDFHQQFGSKSVYLLYQGDKSERIDFEEVIPKFLRNLRDSVLFLRKESLGEDSNILSINIFSNLRNVPLIRLSLDDCLEIARKNSISIDLDESNISVCQPVVDRIIMNMLGTVKNEPIQSKHLADVKQSMLPLQGDCWLRWAEAKRESHKLGKPEMLESANKIMNETRQEQLSFLRNPSSLLSDILGHCKTFGRSGGEFYTIWHLLRNDFNSLSKLHLPPLYEEYKKFHRLSYSTDIDSNLSLDEQHVRQIERRENLTTAAKNIARASFGIEHIFRELGQVFETFSNCKRKERINLERSLELQVDCLRIVAAHLLNEGHAFEIIDGDVNHVAIDWVSGVLESLANIIGHKRKIFVLSILGTQSTGKSTLLNTMFGADFPVSSGRCTRGIFMQLIPIEKKLRSQLKYDYLVILDTEGLRAPELSINSIYKRDNELATLAVGLGDLTLINMSGEGHSDVQDILQIIVFAFIRMKESFSKPRCIFVHQNVPDAHAHTNLLTARSNLIKTLDKMTECAALQENRNTFYKKFADVIEFHPEEEVFYFPGLFEGQPPLNRISAGYSNKAVNLRHCLLNCFSNNEGKVFQTVIEWSNKLKLLWKSVLEEDFVFSYRNALEVTSRFELDHKISSWHSTYIQSLNNWKSESLNQLFNADLDHLDEIWKSLMHQLQQERIQPSIEISLQNKLIKSCFVEHDHMEIFTQWKANTDQYFERKREKLLEKMENEYQMIYEFQKTKKKIDETFVKCRKDIVLKVITLFTEMNRIGVSLKDKSVIDSKFSTIWIEWKSQINVHYPVLSDISNDLQSALLESEIIKSMHAISDKSTLINDTENFIAIGEESFENLSILLSETDSKSFYFTLNNLLKRIHISIGYITNIFSRKVKRDAGNNQFKTVLGILTTECDRNINDYLSSLYNNESPYDQNSFHIIIHQCYETLSKHNSSQKCNFQFSLELNNDFIFDFIFYQCCKAIPTLKKIHNQFISKTSLDIKFNQLEENLRTTFNQLCEGIESEYLCASELAKITMSGLKDSLTDTVPQLFLAVFMDDPKHNTTYKDRSSLILSILRDLARNKVFDDYLSYIQHPINFLVDYIQKQLKRYSQVENARKKLKKKILEKVNLFTVFYSEACYQTWTHEDTEVPIIWMKFKSEFYSKIKHKIRNVSFNDLDVLDIHKISNYSQFCNFYSEELKRLVEETEWIEWIVSIIEKEVSLYKTITDPILECEELCPFCNELCQLSCGTHEHYCGTFHRTKGVNGWRILSNQKIFLYNCTSGIKYKGKFYYHHVLYNYVDYKTVNSRFKSWKILGEDDLDSKYWNWVLYQFEDEFVAHYEILKNECTSQWSNLTEEEVIKDLENHYHNHIFRKD